MVLLVTLYNKKIAYVEENHPSRDSRYIQIPTNYTELYFNMETNQVVEVWKTKIEELKRTKYNNEVKPLFYSIINEDITIEIIEPHTYNHKETKNKISITSNPMQFRIQGIDYIYSIENSHVFVEQDEYTEIRIDQLTELHREANIIWYNSVEYIPNTLKLDIERLAWVFECNDVQVLSRVVSESELDTSKLEILQQKGNYKAYITTYSPFLETYVRISNEINWVQ